MWTIYPLPVSPEGINLDTIGYDLTPTPPSRPTPPPHITPVPDETSHTLRKGASEMGALMQSKEHYTFPAPVLIPTGEQSGLSMRIGDGKRFVVHADDKLTAILELE